MRLNFNEARRATTSLRDDNERAFVEMGMKVAMVDACAGVNSDFDFLALVRILRLLYADRVAAKGILDGREEDHRWMDDRT